MNSVWLPGSARANARVSGRRRVCVPASRAPAADQVAIKQQLRLVTQRDCELAIGIYPKFSYDASAGTGLGITSVQDGRTYVKFDAKTLQIPDLNWRSTKIFGVPLPPPFNISIAPRKLEGWIDYATGQAELEFDAEFLFTAGILDRIHKTPSIQVTTTLSTESATGKIRSGSGTRLVNGRGRLLGIATVPKTGDPFLDNFLMLPTDAFAMLSAEFRPVTE